MMDDFLEALWCTSSLPRRISRGIYSDYKDMTVILLLSELPPADPLEDFREFFAHCGMPNLNERVDFVVLRTTNSGDSILHRLAGDLKSMRKIQRFAQFRRAFICPHADWFSEHGLSADLGIPILRLIDTTNLRSRAQIAALFREADIITPPSTPDRIDRRALYWNQTELMKYNPFFRKSSCSIRFVRVRSVGCRLRCDGKVFE
jgi:hypothetical protein